MNIIEATRSYENWMRRCTHVIEDDLRYKHQQMREDHVGAAAHPIFVASCRFDDVHVRFRARVEPIVLSGKHRAAPSENSRSRACSEAVGTKLLWARS